jgi:hypothetical protein
LEVRTDHGIDDEGVEPIGVIGVIEQELLSERPNRGVACRHPGEESSLSLDIKHSLKWPVLEDLWSVSIGRRRHVGSKVSRLGHAPEAESEAYVLNQVIARSLSDGFKRIDRTCLRNCGPKIAKNQKRSWQEVSHLPSKVKLLRSETKEILVASDLVARLLLALF